MNEIHLQVDQPWLIILCIFMGLGYAGLLYNRKYHWTKQTNWFLASLRFFSVAILCFLLLNPTLKSTHNRTEKPSIVLAIDNSESVKAFSDSVDLYTALEKLDKLQNELSSDFEVEIRSFDGIKKDVNLSELNFNHKETDLSQLLENIKNDYEGRKLSSLILLSDGIINHGFDPNFSSYTFPIHSIGIGDTLEKKDLILREIKHNKIAYQGNDFLLTALISHVDYKNKKVKVQLRENGEILKTQEIQLQENKEIQELSFTVEAKKSGTKHFEIEVLPISEEHNKTNNKKSCYVDIIKAKQKILLLANSPHPDIQTLRSVLEEKKVYDLDLRFVNKDELQPNKNYDLILFHQIPAINTKLTNELKNYLKSTTPKLFLCASQSDYYQLSKLNDVLEIQKQFNKKDEVFLHYNKKFKDFDFEKDKQKTLNNLHPLTVPFANIHLKKGSKVLAFQQIGSIITEKPLIAINQTKSPKSAVIVGEGLWNLQINESFETSDFKATKEILNKLIKLLASKKDKRQFKVYPSQREYATQETIVLNTELYNEIFEAQSEQTVRLKLSNEEGEQQNFEFKTSPERTKFEISGLDEGAYEVLAETKLNNQNLKTKTSFLVQKQQLEFNNSLANHKLLKKIAKDNSGSFSLVEQINRSKLIPKNASGTIYSDQDYTPLSHQATLFFLILSLLFLEWFLRKFLGDY